MIAMNGRLLVRCDMKQKNQLTIAGVVYMTAMIYEINYREKSPVVAQVVSGNKILKEGDVILCHHNHFMPSGSVQSPYYVQDDIFSIPFNKTIFAVLKPDGGIDPVCGNILGSRVGINYRIPIPEPQQYKDRLLVRDGGWTKFRSGDLIFTRPHAPYDIVYIVNKYEYRITKVSEDQVCGVEKKSTKKDLVS
jgi:hypothetical protein